MTLSRVLGPDELSIHARCGPASFSLRVLAAASLAVVLVVGCGSSGSTPVPAGGPGATAAASATAAAAAGSTPRVSGTPDPALGQEIPPGREISEGGGGPVSYTFREEWRRALAEARKWRSGAYLINAVGDMVNDEGVPSSWTLAFIDKAEADAVLRVEIDPWGKVTKTEEVTGEGVASFVDQYTARIPYDIIDTDEVVTIGKAALAARYDPVKTRDPRIALSSNAIAGGALHWTYMLFYESDAAYVSALIDPRTGAVTLRP